MTLTTYSHDHETALAGGFDIVEPGYWVRPDNASIRRVYYSPTATYRGTRADGRSARFYRMREAVEWIGGTER